MALLGGLAAGCSSANGTVPVNPKPPATHPTEPQGNEGYDTYPGATPTAPDKTQVGKLGDTFTLSLTDFSGEPSGTFTLRVDQIRYNVTPDADTVSFLGNVPAGKYLAGVHLSVKAIDPGGYVDPQTLMKVLGSDGHAYEPGSATLVGLPAFSSDTLQWSGQKEDGWVDVMLPKGVTVVSVKYSDNAYTPDMQQTGAAEGTWNVGK